MFMLALPRFLLVNITSAFLLVIVILLSALPAHGAQVSQGAMLANSCAGCHGTDGKSPGSIPSIAGKTAPFIEKSLKEFRDGSRPSTVMGRHAKGYNDEEIRLIADFFANK
jgi:sulfide dehydrogenase cytochrome subunit